MFSPIFLCMKVIMITINRNLEDGKVPSRKDRERAAAHRAKLVSTDSSTSSSAATVGTSTPASAAVSAETTLPPPKTPITLVASTGNSDPPQPSPAVSAGPTPPPPTTPSSQGPEVAGSEVVPAVTVTVAASLQIRHLEVKRSLKMKFVQMMNTRRNLQQSLL